MMEAHCRQRTLASRVTKFYSRGLCGRRRNNACGLTNIITKRAVNPRPTRQILREVGVPEDEVALE